MARVLLYTSDYCGYCSAAKRFLAERGVAYEEVDLSGDDDGRQALHERTGRTTVPQIFVGDTHVGGFTDMVALDRAGGLQPLLDSP
jgi:glutaredoxin 3